MNGAKIALSIFLPLFLLLILRVRVVFLYENEVRAYLSILFFRIPLYPRKRKVSVRAYSYEKQKKRLARQRKKRIEKQDKSGAAFSAAPKKFILLQILPLDLRVPF